MGCDLRPTLSLSFFFSLPFFLPLPLFYCDTMAMTAMAFTECMEYFVPTK